MSGIFGLVHLDDRPIDPREVERMGTVMAKWGDAVRLWSSTTAVLGQCARAVTPEAVHEKMPDVSDDQCFAFTAEARVDNRDELLDALMIPRGDRWNTSDAAILVRAFGQWGQAAAPRVFGDWALAVIDRRARTLLLARDHYGNTGLYYFTDGQRIAFASDRRAILALTSVPRRLNEGYLAKVLVGWAGHGGTETIYSDIFRVPPAHLVHVSASGVRANRYWDLDHIAPVRFAAKDDYVEAFRAVFTSSIQCRIRGRGTVGTTLSAGLDSGSISTIAAAELRKSGRDPLIALTSVPMTDSTRSAGETQLANEWELAHVVAAAEGMVHVPVVAERPTPIEGVRLSLEWHGEPTRAAGHAYWVAALMSEAARRGVRVILSGQVGNASISWPGGRQPTGWRNRLFSMLPTTVGRRAQLLRHHRTWRHASSPWRVVTAINLPFASRLRLPEEMADVGFVPGIGRRGLDAHTLRKQLLQPGSSFRGALAAERGAAFAVESRDPAADIRVLSFVFAIPDELFEGPPRRWLMRRATEGLLPDIVRLNERRGLQAADVVHRVRREHARAVELLDGFVASPLVREYLNVARMRDVLRQLVTSDDYTTTNLTRSVLLRGIAAGLFLQQFDNGRS